MDNLNYLIAEINENKGDIDANYDALKALSKKLVGTLLQYKNKAGDTLTREVLYTQKDSLNVIVYDDVSMQKDSVCIPYVEILNIYTMDLSMYKNHAEYLKELEETRRELLDYRASQLSKKERQDQWYKFADFY